MRGGCLLAVGARRARGSNKFSSVQASHGTLPILPTASTRSSHACGPCVLQVMLRHGESAPRLHARLALPTRRSAAPPLRPPTLTDNRDRSWKQRVWANAGPDWRTQRLNGVAIPPRCLVALWAVRLRDPISCEVFTLTPKRTQDTSVTTHGTQEAHNDTTAHNIYIYYYISVPSASLSSLALLFTSLVQLFSFLFA